MPVAWRVTFIFSMKHKNQNLHSPMNNGEKFYWDLEKTNTTLNKQLLSNSHLNNP